MFDSNQWNKNIILYDSDYAWPNWLCSECLTGHLHPEEKPISEEKMLISKSSKIKKRIGKKPWIGQDNYYVHAVIKLVCNDPNCLSESLLIGKKTIKEKQRDYGGGFIHPYDFYCFEPISFTIPPQVITIPKNKFDGYDKFLYQSFKIFFDDPSSAANKIRIFLDHLAPVTDNENENLHKRLEKKLKQTYPKACELLIACKWIGNDASHQGDITHEDILYAYKFIESALAILYPIETSDPIDEARSVNTNKKSLSKINS